MIGQWIRFGFAALFMLAGLFTLVTSLIGLFRFDFALNRIHAAAMADTMSLLFFLIGVIIAVGPDAVVWKFLLVLVLQWCTSPLCSHMLSQFEYRADETLSDHLDLSHAGEEVAE